MGRPSKWGNPFWHAQRFHGLDRSLALYEQMAHGCWDPSVAADMPTFDGVYDEHCKWIKRHGQHPVDAARNELAGHDLACWCPLDAPCHADVLFANRESMIGDRLNLSAHRETRRATVSYDKTPPVRERQFEDHVEPPIVPVLVWPCIAWLVGYRT